MNTSEAMEAMRVLCDGDAVDVVGREYLYVEKDGLRSIYRSISNELVEIGNAIKDSMIEYPVDTDGRPIGVGDVLHLPGDNDSALVVDGFVVLPTYRSRDFDRSCVITRPDLWRIVDAKEPEDDIKDAEWVELDGVRFVREKTGHIVMGPSLLCKFGDWVPLEMVRHCSECGREINEDAEVNYCWQCGARLEVE